MVPWSLAAGHFPHGDHSQFHVIDRRPGLALPSVMLMHEFLGIHTAVPLVFLISQKAVILAVTNQPTKRNRSVPVAFGISLTVASQKACDHSSLTALTDLLQKTYSGDTSQPARSAD
jgi:hypothetical protein